MFTPKSRVCGNKNLNYVAWVWGLGGRQELEELQDSERVWGDVGQDLKGSKEKTSRVWEKADDYTWPTA